MSVAARDKRDWLKPKRFLSLIARDYSICGSNEVPPVDGPMSADAVTEVTGFAPEAAPRRPVRRRGSSDGKPERCSFGLRGVSCGDHPQPTPRMIGPAYRSPPYA
jgi:hypothetical protein